MVNAQSDFQRARSPQRKQQRAEDLLDAARRLAHDEGARAVTLTEIANTAGVHVSAVRRYFESREEIFLLLADEGWQEWAQALRRQLGSGTAVTADELARTLADTLRERPLFCDLLAHVPLSLERAVSVERVHTFKLSVLTAVEDIAETITTALPDLHNTAARDLITTANALTQALWQISHPPQTLAKLYQEDPRLAHADIDFAPQLTHLLHVCVLGLLAAKTQQPPPQ